MIFSGLFGLFGFGVLGFQGSPPAHAAGEEPEAAEDGECACEPGTESILVINSVIV